MKAYGKLKEGKDLIKKCRTRLQEVENEFVKIKHEFGEEAQGQEVEAREDLPRDNGTTRKAFNGKTVEPDDTFLKRRNPSHQPSSSPRHNFRYIYG